MKRYLATLFLVGAVSLGTRAAAGVNVYVRVGPPAAVVEVRPERPGPRYCWIPGHYRWDDGRYTWVHGHWDRPPRHYRSWARGHWAHHRRRGWFWVEGHWRG